MKWTSKVLFGMRQWSRSDGAFVQPINDATGRWYYAYDPWGEAMRVDDTPTYAGTPHAMMRFPTAKKAMTYLDSIDFSD